METIGRKNYNDYKVVEEGNTRVAKQENIYTKETSLNVGTSDRGFSDREDNLLIDKTPLKTNLTQEEAQKFVKNNPGAEIIIRQDNEKYSIYSIKTTEKGKEILNSDFENYGIIELNKDVLNFLPGTKAYISTSDNSLRTFEKASFSLDFLEDDFITTNLNLNLQDIDGIDKSSKNDLKGTINGNITIDKDLIKYILQDLENKTGMNFDLTTDTKNNQYIIKSYYKGVPIGDLSIAPKSDGLKLNISGLTAGLIKNAKYIAGGIAGTVLLNPALFLAGTIAGGQLDTGKFIEGIANDFSKDMGFKVKSKSDTEYILEPDFTSPALLKEIPLGNEEKSKPINPTKPTSPIKVDNTYVDKKVLFTPIKTEIEFEDNKKTEDNKNKIKIEKVNASSDNINMKLDEYGNLVIDIKKAEIIASTDKKGDKAIPDKEGSDNIDITLKSVTRNDLQTKINTNTNLNINITKEEKESFKDELKKYTGEDISASGNFILKNIKVEATIDKDKITNIEAKEGSFEIKDLNINNNGTDINIKSAEGKLGFKQEGNEVKLVSDNTKIKGNIKSKEGSINISDLSLSGDLVYNKEKPNEIIFNSGKDKGISFTGSIVSGSENTKINKLELKNSNLKVDIAKGKLSINPNSNSSNIRANSIYLNNKSTIQGLSMNGKLDIDMNKGIIDLDAKNLKVSANLDNIKVAYLNGSGKVNFDPSKGLSIKDANIVSSMKIDGFEIKKIQGQGDIEIDKNGSLKFANTKNLEVETNIGLKAKGNLNISFDKDNKTYNILSADKPVEVDFQSKNKETIINNVKFEGKSSFNENTQELAFSTYTDKSLNIKDANINGAIFKETNISNANLKLNVLDGNFTISPISEDKSFKFSSSINGVRIENLESNSNINFDSKNNKLFFDKETRLSIPENNIEYIKFNGKTELDLNKNGLISLSANGTTVNAKFGNIEIQNLKLDGELLYNPKNNTLSIKGNSDKEFKFEGKINGKDISISSLGKFSMKDLGEKLEFTGENIKVNGVLDGFSIESPEGTSGKLVVSKDLSKIDLKELHCNINVEGMNIDNKNGLISFSENGLDIDLSGNINLKKEQLFKLVEKLSKNDLVGENIKNTVKESINILEQNLSKFEASNISYDKFSIKTDKDFNLLDIDFKINTNITKVETKAMIGDKEKNLYLGDINLSVNGNANSKSTNIKNGEVKFNFNEKLREEVAEMIKKEMEKANFRDIKLEVSPTGDVTVSDASLILRKNFLQKDKVKGIKLNFHVDVSVEDNKVNIKLDKLKMKNKFTEIIKGLIGGKNIALNQVEKALADIEGIERTGRNQMTIDLNYILSKQFNNSLNLNNAEITEKGDILIGYEYNSAK